jgi:hypothetical protein
MKSSIILTTALTIVFTANAAMAAPKPTHSSSVHGVGNGPNNSNTLQNYSPGNGFSAVQNLTNTNSTTGFANAFHSNTGIGKNVPASNRWGEQKSINGLPIVEKPSRRQYGEFKWNAPYYIANPCNVEIWVAYYFPAWLLPDYSIDD